MLEAIAYALASGRAREAYDGIKSGLWRWQKDGGIHRVKPYPMGFYLDDPNLYYAIGWGMSVRLMPWSRWLLRRAAIEARDAPIAA